MRNKMTTMTIEEIRRICDCLNCKHSMKCPHRESIRRVPLSSGGVGACWNLKEQLGVENDNK